MTVFAQSQQIVSQSIQVLMERVISQIDNMYMEEMAQKYTGQIGMRIVGQITRLDVFREGPVRDCHDVQPKCLNADNNMTPIVKVCRKPETSSYKTTLSSFKDTRLMRSNTVESSLVRCGRKQLQSLQNQFPNPEDASYINGLRQMKKEQAHRRQHSQKKFTAKAKKLGNLVFDYDGNPLQQCSAQSTDIIRSKLKASIVPLINMPFKIGLKNAPSTDTVKAKTARKLVNPSNVCSDSIQCATGFPLKHFELQRGTKLILGPGNIIQSLQHNNLSNNSSKQHEQKPFRDNLSKLRELKLSTHNKQMELRTTQDKPTPADSKSKNKLSSLISFCPYPKNTSVQFKSLQSLPLLTNKYNPTMEAVKTSQYMINPLLIPPQRVRNQHPTVRSRGQIKEYRQLLLERYRPFQQTLRSGDYL